MNSTNVFLQTFDPDGSLYVFPLSAIRKIHPPSTFFNDRDESHDWSDCVRIELDNRKRVDCEWCDSVEMFMLRLQAKLTELNPNEIHFVFLSELV